MTNKAFTCFTSKHLILLCVFIILTNSCIYYQEKDNTGNFVKAIPAGAIPIIYNNYIHIEAYIDSHKGLFIIDTGADILIIDSTFISPILLNYKNFRESKAWGVGESYQKIQILLDSISFSINGFYYQTSFIPILKLKPVGGDYIDGLFGTDFLMQNALEINYFNEYVLIHNNTDSLNLDEYRKIPMERVDHFFCIPLCVSLTDTITLSGMFIVDTGTPLSIITTKVATELNLDKHIENKVRYYTDYGGIGGESSGFDFIADSLLISDFSLSGVNMSFSKDERGLLAEEKHIGILGNNILSKFDIIFDFDNDAFYLKPNESFKTPFVFNKLGFSYVDRSKTLGSWVVTGLLENSPAESKGLKIDDRIMLINGIPVKKILYKKQSAFIEKLDSLKLSIIRGDELKEIEFALHPLL